MDQEISKGGNFEDAGSALNQDQTIHDIIYRKQTPEESKQFHEALEKTFIRYDQALKNLANEQI